MARAVPADGLSILTHSEPGVQRAGARIVKPIQDLGRGKRDAYFAGVSLQSRAVRRLTALLVAELGECFGGECEFWRAHQRNSRGIRARVLGGEHQRVVRAPRVLRGVCIACQLSSPEPRLPNGTNCQSLRNLRWPGLVSGYCGRCSCRSSGIPTGTVCRVSDSYLLVFPARLDWFFLDGTVAQCRATFPACPGDFDVACSRDFHGETRGCGHNGANFKGKRPIDRLLDLLHSRKRRRSCGSLCGFLGASPHWCTKRLPHFRPVRLRYVLRGASLLQGAANSR